MSALIESLETRTFLSATSLPLLLPAPSSNAAGATAHVAAAHRNSLVVRPDGSRHRPHVNLIGDITRVPASVTLGNAFSATVIITNNGTKTADGTLNVLFEFSTSSNGSNPFQVAVPTKKIDLAPGVSLKVRFSVPTALGGPTGLDYVVAVVDPTDAFKELNLTDNTSISHTVMDVS